MWIVVVVCTVLWFIGFFGVVVFFEGDDPKAPPSIMRERRARREVRR